MSLYDLFHETFLSVTNNKVRSALTILGIVVGISAVILMVSIGQGAQASITSSISSAGANLLTVSSGGGRFGGFGGGGARGGGGGGSAVTLTQADVTLIESLPGVASVSESNQSQSAVAAPGVSVNLRVIGAGYNYDSVNGITTTGGSFIGTEDNRSSAKVCVLGPTAVTDLFGTGADPIGQEVRIGGVTYTVVGITKSQGGSSFLNADEVVYIPLTTLQRYMTGNTNLDSITVQAATAGDVTNVTNEITTAMLSAHNVKDPTQPGFNVQSQSAILSTASTITGTFTLLLASIAGISLLVGGIGIMNMMLTTVTERTREIGLRKAIGARPRDITSQFLTEAVTLCLTGGVIGILLGAGGAEIIKATGLMSPLVTMQSVLLAVGVCAGIGIVFGYYPARRASKLDPIEALRYQ
ncbi:MAG TPA: ABC transporter permease [Coriobacteriia bacterium]